MLIGAFGQWEIIGIVLVVLILFGGRKIPELMRGLGKGIREFNTARAQVKEELEKSIDEEPTEEEKN